MPAFLSSAKDILSLKRGYVIALAVLAVLSIGNFFILNQAFVTQSEIFKSSGHVTSHRVQLYQVKRTLDLLLAENNGASNTTNYASVLALNSLRDQIPVIKQTNQALQTADIAHINEPYKNNISDLMYGEKHNFVGNFNTFINNLEALALSEPALLNGRFSKWAPVQLALAEDGQLMQAIRLLEQEYDRASVHGARVTRNLHFILLSLTLVALILEALLIFRPLLESLSRKHEQLAYKTRSFIYMANHDALTGLQNRHSLMQNDILNSIHREYPIALLMLDLKSFKLVNDNHGHQAGDQLLVHVAEQLQNNKREQDEAFRLGGDEFIVLCNEVRDRGALIRAGKLLS